MRTPLSVLALGHAVKLQLGVDPHRRWAVFLTVLWPSTAAPVGGCFLVSTVWPACGAESPLLNTARAALTCPCLLLLRWGLWALHASLEVTEQARCSIALPLLHVLQPSMCVRATVTGSWALFLPSVVTDLCFVSSVLKTGFSDREVSPVFASLVLIGRGDAVIS